MITLNANEQDVGVGAGERSFVYLVGQGSSGTKRIFNLLDLSPVTHCRMGHQRSPRAPFRDFGGEWFVTDKDADQLNAEWDGALEWAATHFSDTDLMPPPPKEHLSEAARKLRLWSWLRGSRSKQLLGVFVPELRHEEWALPRLFGDRARMSRALLVLKHNQCPGWATWALKNRSRSVILHVVRHPGGYLNAWRGRFQSHQDQDALARTNRARLKEVARVSEWWSNCFGDIDSMDAAEAELWFWRFTTESLEESGAGEPRYLRVQDESMLEDPMGVAERVYEHCGLTLPDGAKHWIKEMAPSWAAKSAPWRELLSSDDVELVERIAGGSAVWPWWSPEQRVSLYNYVAFDPSRG